MSDSKVSNGWALFKYTLSVIRANPKLLLFPAASGAGIISLGLFIAAPVVMRPTGHALSDPQHWAAIGSQLATVTPPTAEEKAAGKKDGDARLNPETYMLFFLFYVLATFLTAFFNTGFAHEIFDALDGDNVSVVEGLQFAASRAGTILKWTLFASFVGTILKALENNTGTIGRWVMKAVGLAWAAASVLAIPALVSAPEPCGPVDLAKRAADVIRKAWGEGLTGYAGLQVGGIVLSIPAFAAIGLGGFLGVSNGAFTPFILGLMAAVLWWLTTAYLMGVADQVFLCVLYRYAATGALPDGLSAEMLSGAFTKPKLWKPGT